MRATILAFLVSSLLLFEACGFQNELNNHYVVYKTYVGSDTLKSRQVLWKRMDTIVEDNLSSAPLCYFTRLPKDISDSAVIEGVLRDQTTPCNMQFFKYYNAYVYHATKSGIYLAAAKTVLKPIDSVISNVEYAYADWEKMYSFNLLDTTINDSRPINSTFENDSTHFYPLATYTGKDTLIKLAGKKYVCSKLIKYPSSMMPRVQYIHKKTGIPLIEKYWFVRQSNYKSKDAPMELFTKFAYDIIKGLPKDKPNYEMLGCTECIKLRVQDSFKNASLDTIYQQPTFEFYNDFYDGLKGLPPAPKK